VTSFPYADMMATLWAAELAAVTKEGAVHFAAMQNHLHLAQIDERFAPPAQTAAVRSGVQQSQPPQTPPRKWRTAAPAHPARKWGSDKYQWDNSVGRRRRERRDASKTKSAEMVQTGNTSAEQVRTAGPPAESTDTTTPAPQAAAASPVAIKVTTTTAATGGTAPSSSASIAPPATTTTVTNAPTTTNATAATDAQHAAPPVNRSQSTHPATTVPATTNTRNVATDAHLLATRDSLRPATPGTYQARLSRHQAKCPLSRCHDDYRLTPAATTTGTGSSPSSHVSPPSIPPTELSQEYIRRLLLSPPPPSPRLIPPLPCGVSIIGKEVSFPWWDESTARGKALVVGIMSSGVGDDNAAWILLFQTGEAKVYEYDEMNSVYPLDNQPQSDDREYIVLYAPQLQALQDACKDWQKTRSSHPNTYYYKTAHQHGEPEFPLDPSDILKWFNLCPHWLDNMMEMDDF